MAVGLDVEMSPLADAVPTSLPDDSSDAIVTSSADTKHTDIKMDPEHDVSAAGATTLQQLRHEAVRCVQPGAIGRTCA